MLLYLFNYTKPQIKFRSNKSYTLMVISKYIAVNPNSSLMSLLYLLLPHLPLFTQSCTSSIIVSIHTTHRYSLYLKYEFKLFL